MILKLFNRWYGAPWNIIVDESTSYLKYNHLSKSFEIYTSWPKKLSISKYIYMIIYFLVYFGSYLLTFYEILTKISELELASFIDE